MGLTRARAATGALLVLLCAACTSGDETARQPGSIAATSTAARPSPSAEVDRYEVLRRPWVIAPLTAGERCPVTQDREQPDPRLAPLWGKGPARPAGLGPGGVLDYRDAGDWRDNSWGGAKVLWAIDPTVAGLVLIRGKRLDGPEELAFEDPAVAELRLNVDRYQGHSGGWKDYPSFTRLRAPGCYVYQIDTVQGTSTVVFTARGPRP